MSILILTDVTYKYEGTKKNVLKKVSAEFEAGNSLFLVRSP